MGARLVRLLPLLLVRLCLLGSPAASQTPPDPCYSQVSNFQAQGCVLELDSSPIAAEASACPRRPVQAVECPPECKAYVDSLPAANLTDEYSAAVKAKCDEAQAAAAFLAAEAPSEAPKFEAALAAPAAEAGPSTPGWGPAAETTPALFPATAVLNGSLSFEDDDDPGTTTCTPFIAETGQWAFDEPGPTKYDTNGSHADVLASEVEAFALVMCADPQAAGKLLYDALQAGGQQAETAVSGYFNAGCGDASPPTETHMSALSFVRKKPGDPSELPAIKEFYLRFVDVADAIGIPMCATLVVWDPPTRRVLHREDIHTGIEVEP